MGALPIELLPDNASIDQTGSLSIAGCPALELAEEFGTPLFVYDEDHLRARCREAVAAFPDGAAYATKAFLCGAMAQLAHEEGMQLDVATGGEIHIALVSGVPPSSMVFHGNNKSTNELARSLELGVGRIVVDSWDELDRIEALVAGGLPAPKVLVRVNPGVEAHTHEFLRTGVTDSKFGIGIAGGEALEALERARTSPTMTLTGIHAHVGSQVFDIESFQNAVEVIAGFAAPLAIEELSIGGGLGVAYVEGETAPSITEWGRAIHDVVTSTGLSVRVMAEPGRAIVAQAAITFYTAGTIKEIPGVRTYVSVDGGMSDNPRPVLYGSGSEVFAPRNVTADRSRPIRLVGKHCESGDVLAWNGMVPEDLVVGDILATPVTGAYGHSMGSNYNMARRPAVVFARDGDARLVVRRETNEDLLARDMFAGRG